MGTGRNIERWREKKKHRRSETQSYSWRIDSSFRINTVASYFRYSLLGERFERFQVNSETGLISTNVLLDREDVSVYRLTLVAQDSSVTEPKASTVNLLINVLDENDNAPVFADSQYMVHVADRIQAGNFLYDN